MNSSARRVLIAAWLLLATPAAGAADTQTWHITFETNWLGPMEAHVEVTRIGDKLHGVSDSGSASILAGLPGDHDVSAGLAVFEATANADGSYRGTFLAPWKEGDLQLTIDGDTLTGTVDGGAFAGSLSGERIECRAAVRDYAAVTKAFDEVVAGKVFSPEDLESAAYRAFRDKYGRITGAARDDLDLLFGFHIAWKGEPFSHFQLRRSHQSALQMFANFDNYRVGFEAATVEFDGNMAVLKVRTMMGADTIEQIEAAYDRIAENDVDTLVIDLRGNAGGAFAVKPLVEHIIDKPVEAGYFLSQVWNREHDRVPTREEVQAAPPWSGWSIVSFWETVQEQGILRVQFAPAEPNFDGKVYVLVDDKSASATELAADALRASGVATLIGEQTAGEMLSQSMFDLAEGFVISLPVADYYSTAHGRIEGQGVPVDIESVPENAMDVVMRNAGR